MIGNKATPSNDYSDIFISGFLLSGLKTFANVNSKNNTILQYIDKQRVFDDDFERVYKNIKKTNLFNNSWESVIGFQKEFLTDLILSKGAVVFGFLTYKSKFCDDFMKGTLGGITTYYVKNLIYNKANLYDFIFGFYSTIWGLKIAAEKELESVHCELHDNNFADTVSGCDI